MENDPFIDDVAIKSDDFPFFHGSDSHNQRVHIYQAAAFFLEQRSAFPDVRWQELDGTVTPMQPLVSLEVPTVHDFHWLKKLTSVNGFWNLYIYILYILYIIYIHLYITVIIRNTETSSCWILNCCCRDLPITAAWVLKNPCFPTRVQPHSLPRISQTSFSFVFTVYKYK